MIKFVTYFKYQQLSRISISHRPLNPLVVFSTQKEPDTGKSQHPKEKEEKDNRQQLNESEKNLIKQYTVDKRWNKLLGIDENHNFQKELILKKKQYGRSTKELREAILFEDLLQNQIKIDIYNTKGKPFFRHIAIGCTVFCTIISFYWSLKRQIKKKPKMKALLEETDEGKQFRTFMNCVVGILVLGCISKHISFVKSYVERIIYDTKKQDFTFTKRNIFGLKRQRIISRYKILYTQNPSLNRHDINYFDISTKEQFAIGYKYAWLKQDLFSHLIAQRIKL